VFVGSGYPAGAFEVEAAYPPGSPPTVNGTTPATAANSSATTSPSRRYCARPLRAPPARPDRWAKAPRRIRLGLTSFGRSTAAPTGVDSFIVATCSSPTHRPSHAGEPPEEAGRPSATAYWAQGGQGRVWDVAAYSALSRYPTFCSGHFLTALREHRSRGRVVA
jgi:hypothetical protein